MTQPPDWVVKTPSHPPIHNEPAKNYQWESLSQDQIKVLRNRLIESIIQVVVQALTGAFVPGGGIGGAVDQLRDWFDNIPLLGDIVEALTGIPGGGLDDLIGWANDLFSGFFDLVPLNSISDFIPNLLMFPNFDTTRWIPSSITDWVLDLFDSPVSGGGSVTAVADGIFHNLLGPNLVRVLPGQQVVMSVKTKWEDLFTGGGGSGISSGVVGDTLPFLIGGGGVAIPFTLPITLGSSSSGGGSSSSAIQLAVAEFFQGVQVSGGPDIGSFPFGFPYGTDSLTPAPVLDSAGSNGSSGWIPLSGTYTVPAGVDAVKMLLQVTDTATGGQVWFGDGLINKTLLPSMAPIDWITGLPDSLADLFNRIKDTIDTILQALLQFTGIDFDNFEDLLSALFDALQNIPGLNILGHGGPLNIIDTIQETWDQWIGGLVGLPGVGAGLADMFNIGNQVSSDAAKGRFSWDVLGILSNKPFWGGLLPTGVSNLPLPLHTSTAPTLPVTQSTATTAFKHIEQSAPLGVVSWSGFDLTNITGFFVNIYKMATDGRKTLVHESSNIIGDVSSVLGTNLYHLPTPLATVATETYGAEFAVRGTGTYNIVGLQTWLPNHPSVFPRNLAAVRNSGTSSPPATIAPGSVNYSPNVPFVEFAVSGGEFNNHDPLLFPFFSAGASSIPIPSWAQYTEVVVLGGAGGGHGGGTLGIGGEGGGAGSWATTTWTRGTHYGDAAILSITVGPGGNGGGAGSNGGNGSSSRVTVGSQTVSGAGGAGGNSFDIAGSNHNGRSPGNKTYPAGGPTYVGGGTQSSYGGAGAAPGGGGSGGNWLTFSSGGRGAVGAVWVRFRQI